MSKKTSRSKKPAQTEVTARTLPRDWLVGTLALLGAALTIVLIVVAARQAELPFCGEGSACDIVQGSRWSVFLGLPIAVWGLFVYVLLALAALFGRKRQARWRAIVFFATVGFAVSIYLNLIAVFVIGATCSYCLVSFVLITVLYALSWRAGGVGGLKGWRLGSTAAAIVIVGLMHLHYSGAFDPAAGPEDPYLRGLAEHLEASGAKFYGASWCPHCQQQKQVFGAAAKRLPYVECAPNGQRGDRSTACVAADIRNYPTWIIGGQRFERAMTPNLLARYSGYAALPSSANE